MKKKDYEQQKDIANKLINVKQWEDCKYNNIKNKFIEKYNLGSKLPTPNYFLNFWIKEIQNLINESIDVDSNSNSNSIKNQKRK